MADEDSKAGESTGEGAQSPPEEVPEDPTKTTPPIPKGPPTPLDLPDQDGLDLPRTG